MKAQIANTEIEGVLIGKTMPKYDDRGYFDRIFCNDAIQEFNGRYYKLQQINHSLSIEKGTIRGCHFQYPPASEVKIVSCLRGSLYDVAIDLRKDSPTYCHYVSRVLSEDNKKFLVIPEGFAHGFQTLQANTVGVSPYPPLLGRPCPQ